VFLPYGPLSVLEVSGAILGGRSRSPERVSRPFRILTDTREGRRRRRAAPNKHKVNFR
jgi:hypothetical protein